VAPVYMKPIEYPRVACSADINRNRSGRLAGIGRRSVAMSSLVRIIVVFRAGACLPHQPPKYARSDEEGRGDDRR